MKLQLFLLSALVLFSVGYSKEDEELQDDVLESDLSDEEFEQLLPDAVNMKFGIDELDNDEEHDQMRDEFLANFANVVMSDDSEDEVADKDDDGVDMEFSKAAQQALNSEDRADDEGDQTQEQGQEDTGDDDDSEEDVESVLAQLDQARQEQENDEDAEDDEDDRRH